MPINGTKIRNSKENKKIIVDNFKSFSWSIEEKLKIINNPRRIKVKCLKKNENKANRYLLFYFQLAC